MILNKGLFIILFVKDIWNQPIGPKVIQYTVYFLIFGTIELVNFHVEMFQIQEHLKFYLTSGRTNTSLWVIVIHSLNIYDIVLITGLRFIKQLNPIVKLLKRNKIGT